MERASDRDRPTSLRVADVAAATAGVVRWRTLALAVLVAGVASAGCTDVRDFRGTWRGRRVGEAAPLRVGFADGAEATLAIEQVDLRWLRARLTIDGDVFDDALIQPDLGAEADVLSDVTFSGSPLRVYFAFGPGGDGAGDPMVVVALYDDDRVEVRVMRGGDVPLYGIFTLARAESSSP